MEQVLLVVQVLLAVALIGMVLLQKSESDGFGLGGGGGNLLSGRSKANLLTRTTAIIAGLFIINSLALSVLAAHGRAPSIIDTIEKQETNDKASIPAVPLAGADKNTKVTEKPVVEKIPSKTETKKEAVNVEQKPAAPEKKEAKKPVVKPADETPEPDHNNE